MSNKKPQTPAAKAEAAPTSEAVTETAPAAEAPITEVPAPIDVLTQDQVNAILLQAQDASDALDGPGHYRRAARLLGELDNPIANQIDPAVRAAVSQLIDHHLRLADIAARVYAANLTGPKTLTWDQVTGPGLSPATEGAS